MFQARRTGPGPIEAAHTARLQDKVRDFNLSGMTDGGQGGERAAAADGGARPRPATPRAPPTRRTLDAHPLRLSHGALQCYSSNVVCGLMWGQLLKLAGLPSADVELEAARENAIKRKREHREQRKALKSLQ